MQKYYSKLWESLYLLYAIDFLVFYNSLSCLKASKFQGLIVILLDHWLTSLYRTHLSGSNCPMIASSCNGI